MMLELTELQMYHCHLNPVDNHSTVNLSVASHSSLCQSHISPHFILSRAGNGSVGHGSWVMGHC